jgi:hypothetical protein
MERTRPTGTGGKYITADSYEKQAGIKETTIILLIRKFAPTGALRAMNARGHPPHPESLKAVTPANASVVRQACRSETPPPVELECVF